MMMNTIKVTKVTREQDDKGTYARPASNNWNVHFDDGDVVEVANWGNGAEALGLCFQQGQQDQDKGRAAEQAVNEFMGW